MSGTASMTDEQRLQDLLDLQEHYASFKTFLIDVMTEVLGFNCSDIQIDIGEYLEFGPQYKMVQAQRSQAKTTITAIYAIWRLIHNPRMRVLIITAGDTLSQEIATLIIRIIEDMPELKCLRADTSIGDRNSVKAYDVHRSLKGIDKSPSVSCMGITANLQGKRADLLIADDIESAKNSQSAVQRDRLAHLTKDFVSICARGDIIYLGTPQHNDSVYNSLPARGFDIRIWPGRYPTEEQMSNYQGFLAPLLAARIAANSNLQTGGGIDGTDGQPIDDVMMPEVDLCKKVLNQGRAYFQLQYMLDTKLTDAERYPLKLRNLLFMNIPAVRAPVEINYAPLPANAILPPQGFPVNDQYFKVHSVGEEFKEFAACVMYVDPAGGGKNGDELAYAIVKFLAGKCFLVACGGIPGGYTPEKLKVLTDAAVKWRPHKILIEENFGKGAFRKVWEPELFKHYKCGVEDVWESGQKELRIIDVLEPIIGSQRLIVEQSLIESDWQSVQKYPVEERSTYSLFFQMARLTRDKGSLKHDDRLDAVSGACRFFVEALAQDAAKMAARIKNDNYQKMLKDPLGTGRSVKIWGKTFRAPNALDKFRRK